MRARRKIARTDSGAAMFLVIGYLAAMTLLASAFFADVHRTMDKKDDAEDYTQAMNIAEGGLNKAVAALRDNRQAYRGEQDTALGIGRFTVRVHEIEGGNYRVDSLGEIVDGDFVIYQVRVEGVLRFDEAGKVSLTWSEETASRRLQRTTP